ncbi:chromo' (CHRromatin Organization MOdifier) domain protein, partial [Ancylostoma duodenale]
SNMGKKNKSRSARRTGSPVGYEEDVSSEEYEITEEIYEVECVVGHRYRRNEIEYKVRWRGWSEQFDEWLHHSKMDCPDAIKEYWKSIDHTKTEESKLSEKDGGRKREHPSSKKSTPSRKSIASPPLKRACTADHEIEG